MATAVSSGTNYFFSVGPIIVERASFINLLLSIPGDPWLCGVRREDFVSLVAGNAPRSGWAVSDQQ